MGRLPGVQLRAAAAVLLVVLSRSRVCCGPGAVAGSRLLGGWPPLAAPARLLPRPAPPAGGVMPGECLAVPDEWFKETKKAPVSRGLVSGCRM